MEEEKAAAYYEELTRKGEGAARFKQGLGFSSSSSSTQQSSNPTRGSALVSSSSFLSTFVRASGPSSAKSSDLDKQTQLENIQDKLKKKQSSEALSRDSDARERDRGRQRSSSREKDRDLRRRRRRRRSRSRSRERSGSRRRERSSSRERDRERRERRRRRSRSWSDEERRRQRSSRERRRRSTSRSASPSRRRSEKNRDDGVKDRRNGRSEKERNGGVDYAQLIDGYAEMTQAERIKAKMKLQLSKTVEKDTKKGMGSGWERFEFNKDAPLDDEEIEAAEDDAVLVKNIGQSFRFSAVEARRDEQIRNAHDEAMFGVPAAQSSVLAHDEAIFGAPAAQPSIVSDEEPVIVDDREYNTDKKEISENGVATDLLSDKVIAKQQGSWRDRARKLQNGSKS